MFPWRTAPWPSSSRSKVSSISNPSPSGISSKTWIPHHPPGFSNPFNRRFPGTREPVPTPRFPSSIHFTSRRSLQLPTPSPTEPVHKEFLGPIGTDPRRELAEGLLADIPENGTVLTYNQKFEKSIIGKLADAFPDLSSPLLALNDRVRDLMLPFQKRWYYHPSQNGSYSIKKVLPALVPEWKRPTRTSPG
jgi:hypothetical protein